MPSFILLSLNSGLLSRRVSSNVTIAPLLPPFHGRRPRVVKYSSSCRGSPVGSASATYVSGRIRYSAPRRKPAARMRSRHANTCSGRCSSAHAIRHTRGWLAVDVDLPVKRRERSKIVLVRTESVPRADDLRRAPYRLHRYSADCGGSSRRAAKRSGMRIGEMEPDETTPARPVARALVRTSSASGPDRIANVNTRSVVATSRRANAIRSGSYVSSRLSAALPFSTAASFHARFTASPIPVFMP